jgi:hypothetical protein
VLWTMYTGIKNSLQCGKSPWSFDQSTWKRKRCASTYANSTTANH